MIRTLQFKYFLFAVGKKEELSSVLYVY